MISHILRNGGKIIQIQVPKDCNDSYFNPSVSLVNGKLWYSLRSADYIQGHRDGHAIIEIKSDKINSKLYLSDELDILSKSEVDLSKINKFDHELMSGIEDVRLFTKNNQLYCQGTVAGPNNNLDIQIYSIDQVRRELTQITNNSFGGMEKNWMYVPSDKESFQFIYWFDRLLLNIDQETNTLQSYGSNTNQFKGSTKLVSYKSGYLGIVHQSVYSALPFGYRFGWNYVDYLVELDSELNLVRISNPIKVAKSIYSQFITGLEIKDDMVYIGLSVLDCIPFILEFPVDLIDFLFTDIRSSGVIEDSEFTKLLTSKFLDVNFYQEFFKDLGNNAASECFTKMARYNYRY